MLTSTGYDILHYNRAKYNGDIIMPQTYTPEFKKKIVRLHLEEDRTMKSITAEFEVSKASIIKWCTEFSNECEDNTAVVIERDEVEIQSRKTGFDAKFSNWSVAPQEASTPVQAQPSVQAQKPAEITAGYEMKKLLSAEGGEYGLFFCLQISDSSQNNYLKKHLEMSKLDAVIYLDANGNEFEDADSDGVAQISLFLGAVLPDRRAKIETSEIKREYAYSFSNNKTLEFIPYEYKI